MSYILDALRKADAERAEAQRDGGDRPGLPLSAGLSRGTEARRRGPRWVAALAVGVGALAVLAGVLFLSPPGSTAVDIPAVQVASTPRPASAVAATAQGSMAELTAAPSQAPALGQGTPLPGVEVRGGPNSGTPPTVANPSPVPAMHGVPEQARRADGPPGPGRGVPTSPEGPRAPAPPLLSELPPAVRQAVPPITLAGLVSSPQRSARLAIVNGQVMREGDRLTPDLVLEEVRTSEVVFSQRGQRFLVRP